MSSDSEHSETTFIDGTEEEKQLRSSHGKNLEKSCKDLIDTYDCNYIDNMGTMLRSAFYKLSQKTKEGACSEQPRRKVLQKLIENHFIGELPIPEFIGGPTTLTVQYSYEYDMTVYIFGEFHTSEINCAEVQNPDPTKQPQSNATNTMPIEDFLDELLKKTNVYLDIFFEIYPFSVSSAYTMFDSQLRMIKIHEKLNTCIHTATRHDKKCHLGRVHWIDIRKDIYGQLTPFSSFSSFMIKFSDILKKFKTKQTLDDLFKEYEEIVDLLRDNKELLTEVYRVCDFTADTKNNISRLFEYFTSKIDNNTKIAKIIQKVRLGLYDQKMFDLIYKIITENLKTKVKNHNNGNYKMYENLKKLSDYDYVVTPETLNVKYNELRSMIEDITSSLFTVDIFIMDFYTMLRVFKTYDTSKFPFTGAVLGDQPKTSHNIIIYAGEYHSIHYRNILRQLKFKRKEQTGNTNPVKTCISTDKIQMPFFQKNKLLRESYNQTNMRIQSASDDGPYGTMDEDTKFYTFKGVYKSKDDLQKEQKEKVDAKGDEDFPEEEDEYDDLQGVNYHKTFNEILGLEKIFECNIDILDQMKL